MRIIFVCFFALLAIAGGVAGYWGATAYRKSQNYKDPLHLLLDLQNARSALAKCRNDPARVKDTNCTREREALRRARAAQDAHEDFSWAAMANPNGVGIYGALPGALLMVFSWLWKRPQQKY